MPEEVKRLSPLTAEGSKTRWRAFRSCPQIPILLEFRSDPHSHRSFLKPKESRARISFFGSTKRELAQKLDRGQDAVGRRRLTQVPPEPREMVAYYTAH